MKKIININTDNIFNFSTNSDFQDYVNRADEALFTLKNESGAGADLLGWKTLPSSITLDQIKEIKRCANDLTEKCDVVIVIGIGGSYIGAKGVIEALTSQFATDQNEKRPIIIWAGQNLSGDYAYELKEFIKTKDIGVIIISKSGTTLEPALAFRYIRKIIEEKYGRIEASSRIIAITDENNGALRELVNSEGYRSFAIPHNVGGRFSVLTAVGLLPIALAGIDIEKFMDGAYHIEDKLFNKDIETKDNIVITYAAVRNLLYNNGKKIELLATFEPKLAGIAEWWKQLFGESEGKDGKGIYPSSSIYSTDLHSIGQYIQDGEKIIMETFIMIDKMDNDITIRKENEDVDGLNYIAGKTLGEINNLCKSGVEMAHTKGGVPNITITINNLDATSIGALLYFFECACAVSAYMLGVNPFNQDGVEEYKKNTLSLCGVNNSNK